MTCLVWGVRFSNTSFVALYDRGYRMTAPIVNGSTKDFRFLASSLRYSRGLEFRAICTRGLVSSRSAFYRTIPRYLDWEGPTTFFLLIAKHCQPKHKVSSFMNASHTLRSNKKFMRRVFEINPSLFSSCATKQLQVDLDLAQLVFADSPEMVHAFMARDPGGGVLLAEQLQEQLQRELDKNEAIIQIM